MSHGTSGLVALGALATCIAALGCTTPLVPNDTGMSGIDAAVGGGDASGNATTDAANSPVDAHTTTTDGGSDASTLDARPACTVAADCDDGDACNGTESCASGHCTAGTALDCNDSIDCTTDSCGASVGCTHVTNDAMCTAMAGGTCDAAAGCRYPVCSAANCMGDPSMCIVATCASNMCVRVSTCTTGSMCCGGACVPSGCDDGNPCTTDACGASGCTHTANTSSCNDGNACTTGDHCSANRCTGTLRHCPVGMICDPDTGTCGL